MKITLESTLSLTREDDGSHVFCEFDEDDIRVQDGAAPGSDRPYITVGSFADDDRHRLATLDGRRVRVTLEVVETEHRPVYGIKFRLLKSYKGIQPGTSAFFCRQVIDDAIRSRTFLVKVWDFHRRQHIYETVPADILTRPTVVEMRTASDDERLFLSPLRKMCQQWSAQIAGVTSGERRAPVYEEAAHSALSTGAGAATDNASPDSRLAHLRDRLIALNHTHEAARRDLAALVAADTGNVRSSTFKAAWRPDDTNPLKDKVKGLYKSLLILGLGEDEISDRLTALLR